VNAQLHSLLGLPLEHEISISLTYLLIVQLLEKLIVTKLIEKFTALINPIVIISQLNPLYSLPFLPNSALILFPYILISPKLYRPVRGFDKKN
jgi:hypothetical protein